MTDEYNTFEQYWKKVQRSAIIEWNETKEYAEEEGIEDPEMPSSAAEFAVEQGFFVNNYPRTIIYHTNEGFDGQGYDRFIRYREFNENPRDMLKALASAAFFNDVLKVIHQIEDAREKLGECVDMIDVDAPIYDEGVTLEYEYEKGLRDPEIITYTFECLRGDEWRVKDPDGMWFEVISPRVIVGDKEVPEASFKLYLDNLCAKREREREERQ